MLRTIFVISAGLIFLLASVSSFGFSDGPYAENTIFDSQLVKLVFTHGSFGPDGAPYPDFGGCSGILISPTQVITAAHCFDGNDFRMMLVFDKEYHRQSASFKNVKVGRNFNGWKMDNSILDRKITIKHSTSDYAMVTLDAPFPAIFPSNAIRIARTQAEAAALVSGECYTAGYGPPSGGGAPYFESTEAPVRVIKYLYGNNKVENVSFIDGLAIHAPSQLTHGDSGGPLVCINKSGERVLVAVNSGKCSIDLSYFNDESLFIFSYDVLVLISAESLY